VKTLVYVATIDNEPRPVLALVRGDHQLHETKLADNVGATAVRTAHPEEIRELLGAGAGSLGGVGARARAKEANFQLVIVADLALKDRNNMTTGANKDDHHLRGVEVERDIRPDKWADLRGVDSGEGCPRCDEGTLEVFKAMEIGHIFKLGTKYSESMGATVLTDQGKPVPIVMGSYGIGVERIITAAIEQHHDADGIIWPKTLAPFDVIVTVTNTKDAALRETAEKLYKDLQRAGLDTLLDDRDERAGVKFKDADLIGIPYRITLGKKVADGIVELFERQTKTSEDVKLNDIVSRAQTLALAGL
jgi:prolyl-tRNA synthetase